MPAAAMLLILTISILVACGGSSTKVPTPVADASESGANLAVVLQPGEIRQLTAAQFYGAGSPNFDFSGVSFRVNGIAGKIDQEGNFTAGTIAGVYPDAVTVEYKLDSVTTKTVTATVTIVAGSLDHVALDPPAVIVRVSQEHRFSASGFDQFENPIRGIKFVFKTQSQIGEIDIGGNLTAGPNAGFYPGGVTVEASSGTVVQTASADVTLVGPIYRISIEPPSLTAKVGQTKLFKVSAFDEFENSVPDSMFESIFEAKTESGSITRWGFFSAGTHAGAIPGAVFVTVKQDDVTEKVSADVQITASPTNQVVMFPGEDFATQGLIRGFSAQGYDWFGNKVSEFTDLERFEEGATDKTYVLRKRNNLLVWFEDGITNEEQANSKEKSPLEVILEIDLETGDFWVTVTGKPEESFDSTLRFNLNLVNERSGPSSNTSFGVSATLGSQIDSDSDNELRYSGNNEALKVWRPGDRISTFGDAFFSGMSDGSIRLEATAFAIGNLRLQ